MGRRSVTAPMIVCANIAFISASTIYGFVVAIALPNTPSVTFLFNCERWKWYYPEKHQNTF